MLALVGPSGRCHRPVKQESSSWAMLELVHSGRAYTGVGSPESRWLFPGLLPGKLGRCSTVTHLATWVRAASPTVREGRPSLAIASAPARSGRRCEELERDVVRVLE
jgi:hypothetical protein